MKQTLTPAMLLSVVALAGTTPVLGGHACADDPVQVLMYQPSEECVTDLGLAVDDACGTIDECCTSCYRGPCWTVGAGMVIKRRNRCFKKDLVRSAGGEVLMDYYDLDPGWGAGPWFEIIRHFDSGLDFEIEYFSIDNFTQTAEAHNGSPEAEWTDYWSQFVFEDLWATYSNDLYSLEFNLRWPVCDDGRWKGIAGFRWIKLQEDFAVQVNNTVEPIPYPATGWGRLTLDNHLYGFQLGAEGILWQPCPRFWVEGLCKAGIYNNHADRLLHTEVVWYGGTAQKHIPAEDDHLAFASEIALMGVFKPCCCMKLFLGYEAFHLKEVATIKVQDKCHGTIILDNAFFYGFVVGAEVSFGKRKCCPCPEEVCACE